MWAVGFTQQWIYKGSGVTMNDLMWVKEFHKPSPVITIFVGGMFAIPRKMGGKNGMV